MKYRNLNLVELKNRKSKWQGICDYTDAEGKRKFKRKSFDTTSKREAWRLAEDWFNEINQQAEEEEVKAEDTLEEVIEVYLENQQKRHFIGDSSYRIDRLRAKEYIYPYIGSLGFTSIERSDIEKWITTLFRKGYANNTIKSALAIVSKTYNEGLRLEQVDKNPCSLVKVPLGKARKAYLTDEQMKDYVASVWLDFDTPETQHLLLAFLLIYYLGLRACEVLALRFRDIDFEKNTITVRSNVAKREGGYYLKDPKTPSSIRQINIPQQLVDLLKNRYESIGASGSWFVCGFEEEFISYNTLCRHFKNMVDNHNLKDAYGNHLTLHGLRHNVGYSGVRSGMDIGALSRILGHSKTSITLDVYSDTSPDAVKAGMEKLSNFFKERDLDE